MPENAHISKCDEKEGKISKRPKGLKTIINRKDLDMQEKGGKISNGLRLSEIKQERTNKQKDLSL